MPAPTGISFSLYTWAKPNLGFLSPAQSHCLGEPALSKPWKQNTPNSTLHSVAWRRKVECWLLFQKIRESQAGVGRAPLLINVTWQMCMSQKLSSLHHLHVSLGLSLHKVKHCVLFMANSEVLLNCHVLFKQTHTHKLLQSSLPG